MKQIFKNEQQQKLFKKNGYIVVPLLTPKDADRLSQFFNSTRELHKTTSALHHTTTDTANADLIYKVDAKIKSVMLPELEKILLCFKPLVGCYHIKEPGNGSETGIHQDPTFVDESKYYSANVWVALQDIDEKNGNLFFVNGSNHVSPSLRVTPYSPSYYDSFYGELSEMITHVPLKKGEAVIFNNATIHGATENLTNDVRLAATLLVCSDEAQWKLYYRDKEAANELLEEYHLDLDTFVSMPKDGRPSPKALQQHFTYKFPRVTKEEFIQKIGRKKGGAKTLIQKVKDVFGV